MEKKNRRKKNIKDDQKITVNNDEDYKNFVECLENYKKNSKNMTKKKEYQKCEKKMFKFLEISITKPNKPEKDELYENLKCMFETMLYTRWKIIIRKGGTSLFYDLLCNVCGIRKKNKENLPKLEEIKTGHILQNIDQNSDIYNNTGRKMIGGVLTGIISLSAMPLGGFFASALSKLPSTTIMELIEKKSKIDVGFTTMPKTLWKRLGQLPDEYKKSSKYTRRSKSLPKGQVPKMYNLSNAKNDKNGLDYVSKKTKTEKYDTQNNGSNFVSSEPTTKSTLEEKTKYD